MKLVLPKCGWHFAHASRARRARVPVWYAALALSVAPSLVHGDSVTWQGGAGDWHTGTNWNSGAVPVAANDVFIDGGKTGVASSVSMAKSASVNNLTIDAGDSLGIGQMVTLNVARTLTINGAATLGTFYDPAASLTFTGTTPHLLTGSGELVFGSIANGLANCILTETDVTVGPSLLIHGSSGRLQVGSTGTLFNQGTICADQTDFYDHGISVYNVNNTGVLRATNGALLTVTGLQANNGVIDLSAGGRAKVYASIDSDKFGTFKRTSDTSLTWNGTITNYGRTWDLDTTTGTVKLSGAQVLGGTIAASAGSTLDCSYVSLYAVTLSTPAKCTDVWFYDGLTLSSGANLMLGWDSSAVFANSSPGGTTARSIAGTGTVTFTNPESLYPGRLINSTDAPLTIGENVLIHGTNGRIEGGGGQTGIVNRGTVRADVEGGMIGMFYFTNQGTLQSINGGILGADYFVNAPGAIISVAAGSALTFGSTWTRGATWHNDGTITVTDGTVNLGGAFSFSDIGTLTRIGTTTVNLTGTLNNSGKTLTLDNSTGPWILKGGIVDGGSITTVGTAQLVADNGCFNDLTLNAPPVIARPGGGFSVAKNVTLNGITVDLSGQGGPNYGVITLTTPSWLVEHFSANLGGTAEIILGNINSMVCDNCVVPATIGPGIWIHGANGKVHGNDPGGLLTIQGTIAADAAGGTVSVGEILNQGTLQALNGGTLSAFRLTNAQGGSISVAPGSTLTFSSTWHNDGTISVNSGTVNLGGTFDFSDIGTLTRSGASTINLTGTLTNTGQTLALDSSTGSWVLNGGTVNGGAITTAAPATLVADNGYLKNVTLNSAPVITRAGGGFSVTGNLDLNGVVLDLSGGGGANYGVVTFGSGTHTLGGTGEILLGNANSKVNNIGSSLIIGSGIVIHGKDGRVYGPLSNQGTIAADVAGGQVNISKITNTGGTVRAVAGATINSLNAYTQSSGTTQIDGTFISSYAMSITGGTLCGSGTVAPPASVGGTLSPGNSIGTISFGAGLSMLPGSHWAAELSDSDADLVQITGNLDLSAVDDCLDLYATQVLAQDSVYTIATYSGQLLGAFDAVTPGYEVSYAVPGQVEVRVVPEPAFALVVLFPAAWAISRRRRLRCAAVHSRGHRRR